MTYTTTTASTNSTQTVSFIFALNSNFYSILSQILQSFWTKPKLVSSANSTELLTSLPVSSPMHTKEPENGGPTEPVLEPPTSPSAMFRQTL